MTWEGRLTFEVSSSDSDSDTPVWVDLTSRILDAVQPVQVGIGRQNDLEQAEPAVWTMVLNNADDALTYGSISSPYPWWGPGRKCRLRETIGGFVNDVVTGYLQTPTETVALAGIDQTVSVSIVDRLARLQTSTPFISTVAAHVMGTGHASLQGYWPLLDPAPPFFPAVGTIVAQAQTSTGSLPDIEQHASLSPAGGPSLPGDDAATLKFLPGLNGGFVNNIVTITFGFDVVTPIVAGQVLTVVAWVYQDVDYVSDFPIQVVIQTDATQAFLLIGKNPVAVAGDGWFAQYADGGGPWIVSATDGSANATKRWYHLAVRWGFSPNVLELWVDDKVYTGTFATVVTTANDLGFLIGAYGSMAHIQRYIGTPSDFTNADFLAQREVGLYGLERQTTGQRIRTVLTYAGVPSAVYANTVDPGCAVMQRARLAGQTPLDAMREAETTDQGLLYVDGSGNLIFKDRRSLYNI